MLNRNNTPFIYSQFKKWLNKEKINHESYSIDGFIIRLQSNNLLIRFNCAEKRTGIYYASVQHYPYNKIHVQFPASDIDTVIKKLKKFKFL